MSNRRSIITTGLKLFRTSLLSTEPALSTVAVKPKITAFKTPSSNESSAPDLQYAPEGVNVAVIQESDVDVQPSVTVAVSGMSQDFNRLEPVEITEITGQFENVQIGEDSNILSRPGVADDGEEAVSLPGTRSPTRVTTRDNLHFIIDSPEGVIQIGKCCILLRVNFSNSLVSRLLDEGDVNVRLQSGDTLLQLQWSNWDLKKEGIRSRIKIEIVTALEEQRETFEKDIIKLLLNRIQNYMELRAIVNTLYDNFGAMLHKITGGCIELWIMNDTHQQLKEMRMRKAELESILTDFFSFYNAGTGIRNFKCSVTFLDDLSKSEELLHAGFSFRSDTETDENMMRAEKPVTREEMQQFVTKTVGEAIKAAKDTEETSQKLIATGSPLEGLSRVELREFMRPPIEPRPIYHVRKEELLGVIWHKLTENMNYRISEIEPKGKTTGKAEELILSLYIEMILKDMERLLPEEQHIDLARFKADVYGEITTMNKILFRELERLSAFAKEQLSETEVNEFKVKTKTAVEMCSRMLAAHAKEVVTPPQPAQVIERLIKEPGEADMSDPDKKEELPRPVDAENRRLRKEQLLQQATTPQKDFQKQELDFYEINENPHSTLPELGTRVEPNSKRALLQASLQGPRAEASARREAAEDTFGTVVSHAAEDEEQVIVHWDNPDESFLYHESNIRTMTRQVPRKIMREQQVGIGVYVEKSANWTFEDQAGPIGVGTVIRHDLETGLVQVKWHGGVPGWNSYRIAEDVETRKECFIDGEEQSSDD